MQKVRIALRWLHRQIPKASRKCCGLWASLGGRYFTDSEFESFKSFLLSDAPLSKLGANLCRVKVCKTARNRIFRISYLLRFPGGSRTIQDVSLAWIYAGLDFSFVKKRAEIHRKSNDRPGNYFMVPLAVNSCQFLNEVSCVSLSRSRDSVRFQSDLLWSGVFAHFFSWTMCMSGAFHDLTLGSFSGVPPRESRGGARRCIKSSIRRVQFGYCIGRGSAARAYLGYSILLQHVNTMLGLNLELPLETCFLCFACSLQYTWLICLCKS